MKKQYINPSTLIVNVQLQGMLCESIAINSDTTVNAGSALGRRGGSVWDDDEDDDF